MRLTRTGTGLGKYVFSPAAVVALLVLLSTAVVLAAPPTKAHPPKDQPSASVQVDEDETAEAEESEDADEPEAGNSPGACNALHGNAYQVISDLVANWPTKHDKGDKTKDVPPGLQKVLDRLLECQAAGDDPDASVGPEDPDSSPSATAAPKETTKAKGGKKADRAKDH
jgi:uncharacterized membrane protein YdfJ with MMPL/SSD domain